MKNIKPTRTANTSRNFKQSSQTQNQWQAMDYSSVAKSEKQRKEILKKTNSFQQHPFE